MRALAPSVLGALLLGAVPALAQAPGPSDPGAPAAPPPAPTAASAPQPTVITRGPAGSFVVTPAERDPNQSLPSSSRPKSGDDTDSFDMNVSKGGGGVVANPNGTAILPDGGGELRGRAVPPIHLVRHGDTLWDLSDGYYGNPWQWPKIWGMNPQVKNPHWIYPGDQLRMLPGDGSGMSLFDRLGGAGGNGKGGGGAGGPKSGRDRLVKDTVVLRDQGFLGDPSNDTWGELAGSSEEQMLLSEGNHVFLLLKPDKTARPGELLTLFRPVRPADDIEGARKPPGEIVQVLGTVKVQGHDPKTHMARGTIVESLDIIERGAKVGPVRRRFAVVPPLKADKPLTARILASFYPHIYFAQNQVAFIDRGSEDGLKPGNRLVVLRRGDTWRQSLGAKMTRDRMRLDNDKVVVERTPMPGDDDQFPEEAVAELRVLTTERYSSLALVTQSRRELYPGDVATTRPGF